MKNEKLIQSFVFETCGLLYQRELQGYKSKRVLFILFDAGETKSLQPVLEELVKAKMEYQVLAFGTAWTLMKDCPETINIHTTLGIPEDINQKDWGREQPLESKVKEHILKMFKPDIVVTGMVSEIQRELVEGFKNHGAEIIAYFDSFSPVHTFAYAVPFLKLASVVLAPSKSVADSIQELDPDVHIDIVGQPVVEQWISQADLIDPDEIRKSIHIDTKKPFLVYITGYGEGYAESFNIFAEAIQYVDHFHVGLSLHPKISGDLERDILKAKGCKQVFFIPKDIDTSSVVACADLVVTRHSTVGVFAAMLGKPVVYLDQKGSQFTSLAIEKGWAAHLFDSGEFLKFLIEFEKEFISSHERFSEGGVPQKSAELIFRRILKGKGQRNQ